MNGGHRAAIFSMCTCLNAVHARRRIQAHRFLQRKRGLWSPARKAALNRCDAAWIATRKYLLLIPETRCIQYTSCSLLLQSFRNNEKGWSHMRPAFEAQRGGEGKPRAREKERLAKQMSVKRWRLRHDARNNAQTSSGGQGNRQRYTRDSCRRRSCPRQCPRRTGRQSHCPWYQEPGYSR